MGSRKRKVIDSGGDKRTLPEYEYGILFTDGEAAFEIISEYSFPARAALILSLFTTCFSVRQCSTIDYVVERRDYERGYY